MVHAEFCVNETGALLHCTTLPIWSLVWRGSLVPLSQLTLTESLWLARWVHITQYNGLSASQCILISSFSSRSVLQLALRFSFSFSMQIRIRRTRYKDLCVDNIQRNVRSLGKCRNSRTVEFTIFVLNRTKPNWATQFEVELNYAPVVFTSSPLQRYACFAKQQPGRARHKFLATAYKDFFSALYIILHSLSNPLDQWEGKLSH